MARPQTIHLSVKDFALPAPRTGSIEAHSGYGSVPPQGVEIHTAYQAKRRAEDPLYQVEVPLHHTFKVGKLRFKVSGRADGIDTSGGRIVVDELKSAFEAAELVRKLRETPDHPYLLQLQTYVYLYRERFGKTPEARMIVISSRTRVATGIEVPFDPAAYEAWLARRLAELVAEEKVIRARQKRRAKTAAALGFPFAAVRPGQADLMRFLEEEPKARKHVLIQAPTGLGKTMGTMFPLVKEALARGAPLLYVTPKNSQHRVAEHAVKQLTGVRSITLTAKSRICLLGEPVCDPVHCPCAKDHYEKVARLGLVEKLAKKRVATEDVVKTFAKAHEVCPHELSLMAAPSFDVVIGDYNYVIQPHGLVGRIEAVQRADEEMPSLIVDEAHNLFPRANDNLSGTLSRREVERLAGAVAAAASGASPSAAGGGASMAGAASGADAGGRGSALSGRGRIDPSIVATAQALATSAAAWISSFAPVGGGTQAAFEAEPVRIAGLIADANELVARYLVTDAVIEPGDPVLALGASVRDFAGALAASGEEFARVYERTHQDELLRVICCDASAYLKEAFAPFARIACVSATLKPFGYYAQLSGFDAETVATAEFPSPFPRAHRKLLVIPQVSTKLRDRGRNAAKIGDAIGRLVAPRPGNYIAFFPSFAFLGEVAAHVKADGWRIVRQTPGMSRADTSRLIQTLAAGDQPTLVLAVQGGALAEGVDFPGDLLIGAIVVGPALPSCDLPREILRKYYDARHGGKGDDYAYTYPAMTKVIQAAGRVIRTETDRGLIVLMDARFVERRYTDLFPRDWYDQAPQELVSRKILDEINAFWRGEIPS